MSNNTYLDKQYELCDFLFLLILIFFSLKPCIFCYFCTTPQTGSSNDEELLAIVDDVLNGGLNACCGASGSLRVAKLLLAHGATPAYPSSQDFDASPIHRCVQFGHDNLFALLLTHKVRQGGGGSL